MIFELDLNKIEKATICKVEKIIVDGVVFEEVHVTSETGDTFRLEFNPDGTARLV